MSKNEKGIDRNDRSRAEGNARFYTAAESKNCVDERK
jgi:hypothetical protein